MQGGITGRISLYEYKYRTQFRHCASNYACSNKPQFGQHQTGNKTKHQKKPTNATLKRFTISYSDSLAADFDHWLQSRGYSNRSEGVRDLRLILGNNLK